MKLVPGSSSALWKNLRNTFGKLWWQECNRWQLEERLDDVIKCKCDEAFSKVHPQEQELNCLSKAAVKNFKKDVKRAFKKKSQLSRERLTSMLDDVMAEFSQKASPYLCSLRTNVGMCLSWELRTSAAKLLLASDHIIISCDFMSDCSEPQTLTAGSVGCHARALGYQRSSRVALHDGRCSVGNLPGPV